MNKPAPPPAFFLGKSPAHERWLITAFVVACLLPFLNKAVHIDDPLFVWTAKWIQQHPGDFFGATVNWFGVATPMSAANFNPPGISYLLAAVGAAFGWSEWVLHGALLLVAVGAALGVYSLARQWCSQPLWATLITIVTPVFFVSATTLMSDLLMFALWIWAVALWERGVIDRSFSCLFLAGLLMGAAILTKYSAVTLLPVLFLLGVLRIRRWGVWLVALAVPLVLLGVYEYWTARLYQRGLFSLAREYAAANTAIFEGGLVSKYVVAAVFVGGCLLPVLCYGPILWRGRRPVLTFLICFGLVWGCLSTFEKIGAMVLLGQSRGGEVFQIALLATAGIHVLVLTVMEWWQRRDAVTAVLAVWVLGGLLFATVLNWTISARSLLPIAPAVAILLLRRLERISPPGGSWLRVGLPLVPALLVTLAVAIADASLANSARTAAREMVSQYAAADRQVWFQGHWGFQYYMQDLGAMPVDFQRSIMRRGDALIVPANASNTTFPPAEAVATTAIHEFPTWRWFSTMRLGGTGFYAADWGPLPFGFITNSIERYYVFRLAQDIRYQAPPAPQQNLTARPGSVIPDNAGQSLDTNRLSALKLATVAMQLEKEAKPEQAVARYREALQYAPDDPLLLNNLAWLLATHSDERVRDAAPAIQYAERACQVTDNGQAFLLGTLAAAYAEAGRFADAVATAQRAIELATAAGQNQIAARNAELLELYRAGKPYHEPAK